MVTQNKTWRFSKRINNDNYNVWRKSTLQHFDLGAVISSLLKTPPLPPPPPLALPPPLPLPEKPHSHCTLVPENWQKIAGVPSV